MSANTTTAVCFDLYGTLIHRDVEQLDESILEATSFLLEEGYRVTEADLTRAIRSFFEICHNRAALTGEEVDLTAWWSGVLGILGIAVSEPLFIRSLHAKFRRPIRRFFHLYTSAKDALSTLKRSHKLGLITNSFKEDVNEDLAYFGLSSLFEGIFVSSEIGKRKPHPEIFLAALNGLKTEPSSTIHVGDHVKEDVAGAKRVHMKTILLRQRDGSNRTDIPIFPRAPDVLPSHETPDAVVNTLVDVPAAVERFFSRRGQR